MCDPVSVVTGFVGGQVLNTLLKPSGGGIRMGATDPATERANAEAKASQDANLRLAATQKRRREQAGLLARGAPAVDQPSALDTPLSADGAKARKPPNPLLQRGAPASFFAQ
jgi:hypothetical protein